MSKYQPSSFGAAASGLLAQEQQQHSCFFGATKCCNMPLAAVKIAFVASNSPKAFSLIPMSSDSEVCLIL